ncbi:MAG: nucleoside deaminase [Methylocystis sp.]|uniref:nucleoside deaminase n=1 Tax=Methylocystis sp. TaxID=1911079 RepID=UPI003DA62BCB
MARHLPRSSKAQQGEGAISQLGSLLLSRTVSTSGRRGRCGMAGFSRARVLRHRIATHGIVNLQVGARPTSLSPAISDKGATGGPFGALVVLDGKVLGASGNSVMRDKDPSAHAEVNAIRMACRAVGSRNIPGAVLYSSCEPCPMCYSIAYWARIGRRVLGSLPIETTVKLAPRPRSGGRNVQRPRALPVEDHPGRFTTQIATRWNNRQAGALSRPGESSFQ